MILKLYNICMFCQLRMRSTFCTCFVKITGADLLHLLLPHHDGADVLLRLHLPLAEAQAEESDSTPVNLAHVYRRNTGQPTATGTGSKSVPPIRKRSRTQCLIYFSSK
jgi:hypothetical protein